jgi:hypothetical protein
LFVNLSRSAKCGLYIVANIFRAYDFLEFRLMDQAGGLRARAANNQNPAAGVQLPGNFFDGE